MVTREDVENFLLRLEIPYQELQEGLWVVGDVKETAPVFVNHDEPLLLMRVEVMDAPADEELRKALFRELLELNATDLVHGAYGLDGDGIVLIDSLQLEDLDFSEFQASLESIMLALRSHFETLSRYRTP
ncbi:MAG: YbjN domain-containing protein [Gemmatimonadota bacterium]|nr:MAG: YbjN domain-containing protein [Gemmatimonadota bacterium]